MRAFVLCLALTALIFSPLSAQEQAAPDVPSLVRAGDAAFVHGNYEAARKALASAWDLLQATPPENPARYDVLKRLVSVRAAAGEYADAEKYQQMATAWRTAVLGPDDPRLADDTLVSVALYRATKQFDRAFSLLPGVIAAHTRAFGFDSTAVADDYWRMAQLLTDQDQPENAASALAVVLDIRTRLTGPLDASLLAALDRSGALQLVVRDYPAAETTFRHALVIRETLVGKNDSDLLATLDGLAYSLANEGKFDEAEPLYQRLLALWMQSAGEEHPMVAITLDKIVNFYNAQKKPDRAAEAAAKAIAIRAHFLGSGLSTEATRRMELKDMEAAKTMYQRVIKVLDPPNPLYDKLRAQAEKMQEEMAQAAAPAKKAAPAAKKP